MAQFDIILLMSGITGDLATPSVEGEVGGRATLIFSYIRSTGCKQWNSDLYKNKGH